MFCAYIYIYVCVLFVNVFVLFVLGVCLVCCLWIVVVVLFLMFD